MGVLWLGVLAVGPGLCLTHVVWACDREREPGLPKDMTCYLFGLSPMPFWIFALVSTLGRIPGTWILSAQGAHTASGDYVEVILITAVVVAVSLPLYYYRSRIVAWFQGRDLTREGRRDV